MKTYKAQTGGSRGMTSVDYSGLTKKEPEKSLLFPLKGRAGRGSDGRITVRHQGGGVKRMFRLVEYGQFKLGVAGKVTALEYDPNRTAFLALVEFPDKEKIYILAPQDLKVGDEVVCAEKTPLKNGNRTQLKNMPVGSNVYNVSFEIAKAGIAVKGAGTCAQVLAQDGDFTQLKMPSGEVRQFKGICYASIGTVSNPEHRFVNIGKAGRARLMGHRPAVRGTAMNPCDHPHGGGEGRQPIGLKHPKTPWGKPTLGVKTRKKHKMSSKYIIQRRIKKV